LRLDHNVTAKDTLMIRLSRPNSDQVNKSIAFNGDSTANRPRGAVAGYTRLISARMVNELRVGFQRYDFNFAPEGLGTDLVTPLGLPVFGASADILRFPSFAIRNFASLGGNNTLPVIRAENNYQLIDDLSWYLGRHSIKVGGDARWFELNNFQPQTVSGSYTFNGPFTGVRGSQYANGLPDLLLGRRPPATV